MRVRETTSEREKTGQRGGEKQRVCERETQRVSREREPTSVCESERARLRERQRLRERDKVKETVCEGETASKRLERASKRERE